MGPTGGLGAGNERALGGSVVQRGCGSAAVCGSGLICGAIGTILGGVGGTWGASRGGGGYLGGGSPALLMDLPRRGVVPGEVGVAAVRFGIGFRQK